MGPGLAAVFLIGAAHAQTRDQAARQSKVSVRPTPTPTPRPARPAGQVYVRPSAPRPTSAEVQRIRPGTTQNPASKPTAVVDRVGRETGKLRPGAEEYPAYKPTAAADRVGKETGKLRPGAADYPAYKPTPGTDRVGKETGLRPGTSEIPPPKPPAAVDFTAREPAAKLGASELLRQSHYAQAQGDLASAKSSYDGIREAAKKEKAPAVEAQAALRYAQTIQSLDTKQLTNEHVSEAKTAYSEAIRLGTPNQKVQAQNDLAVLSLKEGNPKQAIATLREVDVEALEPEQRTLYTYNYGRALELSGNGTEAYQKYTQALEKDPGFDLASEGAFRLLGATHPAPVNEAARLAEKLLARGEEETASREVRRALDNWAAEPEAQRLLAVQLRYYVASRIDPKQFQKTEWPALKKLAERGPQLAPAIKQIGAAYAGEVPVFVERGSARGFFNAWSPEPWKTEPFSRLLKSIGDSYDRAERPRQALALYSGAWSLDPGNTESALYVALTLRDHPESLDPSGRLLDRLTESVFEEKGIAYQKGDWVNILRQHVLLATLFEKQGKWGPQNNPRSAIFQWTNALRADDQIRQREPSFPLSPGIYLHLGECHEKVGDPRLAWSGYTKAAYAFLKASKPEEASAALDRARALIKYMTPEQLETVRILEEAITRSRQSRG